MIIMKFGGTSVQDAESMKMAAEIIRSYSGRKPVVVVSAAGKTTDNLLKCGASAAKGNIAKANEAINEIEKRHLKICSDLLSNKEIREDTVSRIKKLTEEIRDLLKGMCLLLEVTPRSSAKLLSYGELLSSAILCGYLNEKGIKSSLHDSRSLIITNGNFLKAEPVFDETKKKMNKEINETLNDSSIPVMQGFIGSTKEGATSVLGFEGSDFTASIAGSVLDAEEIIIWTDVDGLLTADPRYQES
jgi:aspartate kinase